MGFGFGRITCDIEMACKKVDLRSCELRGIFLSKRLVLCCEHFREVIILPSIILCSSHFNGTVGLRTRLLVYKTVDGYPRFRRKQ